MVKFIVSLTKFIIVAIAVLLFSACESGRQSFRGSGHIVSKSRTIQQPFTGVRSGSGLEVIVIQSDLTSVTVETDDNMQDKIITEVEDGILHVKTEANGVFNSAKAKITVNMPTITMLEANSGSSLRSGSLITSEQLVVKSSSGSTLNVNAEADQIVAESSSGSTLKLRGKALKLETSSSSGSTNDARDLHANEVESQSSSGSSCYVRPIVSLKGDASSGSSIVYYGTPKTFSRKESSGGSISGK